MMDALLRKIEEYTEGAIRRDAFENWFYDLSFDVETRYAGPVVDLVHEVEGLLAESSSGGWTPGDLQRELVRLVERYTTVQGMPNSTRPSSAL